MIRGIIIRREAVTESGSHESVSHDMSTKDAAGYAKACDNESNPDWEYMKHCNEVDQYRPETWKVYPKTIAGANDIIKMEYDELMKCAKIGDMKGWEENIYHLSVALLNAWRIYKHDGK